MKINTIRFGELECKEEEVLTFSKGIFGFPEETQFYLVVDPEQAPFMWLQSTKTPYLAFIILDPWVANPDYVIDLSKEIKEELSITSEDQVVVLGIVVVPDDAQKMTINLRAPLIINSASKIGEQLILSDDRYDIRHPVFKG